MELEQYRQTHPRSETENFGAQEFSLMPPLGSKALALTGKDAAVPGGFKIRGEQTEICSPLLS